MRRRHRYLAHLPLTCEFSICELALQPPILSKETMDTFAGQSALHTPFKSTDVLQVCYVLAYLTFFYLLLLFGVDRWPGEEEAPQAEEGKGWEA